MPRLILLNGPPGSGKSTLASRYAEEHPLCLNLDIDRLRGMLGGWWDDPTAAGLHARRLAIAMAREQLSQGHDVVIPQYLGRIEFVLQLERLADEVGARFHECVLLLDKAAALRRFAERSAAGELPAHLEAQRLLDRFGGADELAAMHDRLVALVAARPATLPVPAYDGDPDRSYQELRAALER